MTAQIAQQIVRYADLDGWRGVDQALDEIFFAASATQYFADEATRRNFRERWLGRYLGRYAEDCLIAFDEAGSAIGFLVGCPEDAARLPDFADIDYLAAFAGECARYPAHFHMNIRAEWQGRGLGRRLVVNYAANLAARGISGVHVVTAGDAANLGFYRKCGLLHVTSRRVTGRRLVMLGRHLTAWRL